MNDIWIISWFNHTAFDANPGPGPKRAPMGLKGPTFFWDMSQKVKFGLKWVLMAPFGKILQ